MFCLAIKSDGEELCLICMRNCIRMPGKISFIHLDQMPAKGMSLIQPPQFFICQLSCYFYIIIVVIYKNITYCS